MTETTSPGRPTRAIAPPTITSDAPRLADASRDDGRTQDRDFVRQRPRDPSEKYDLRGQRLDPKMSYFWASLKIPYSSQRNPRLDSFRRAGWQFARAADFPEQSGYRPGKEVNERFVELGIDDKVSADDPVIRDNLVLMVRPKVMTDEAEREQKVEASRQINDHLRQQKDRSVKAIGENRTTMSRHVGPADEAPSDAAAEI